LTPPKQGLFQSKEGQGINIYIYINIKIKHRIHVSGIYLHLLYHKKSTIHIGKYTIVPLIRDGYSDIGIITCDSGQKNQKNFRYRNLFPFGAEDLFFSPMVG